MPLIIRAGSTHPATATAMRSEARTKSHPAWTFVPTAKTRSEPLTRATARRRGRGRAMASPPGSPGLGSLGRAERNGDLAEDAFHDPAGSFRLGGLASVQEQTVGQHCRSQGLDVVR